AFTVHGSCARHDSIADGMRPWRPASGVAASGSFSGRGGRPGLALFPYTTLFRSRLRVRVQDVRGAAAEPIREDRAVGEIEGLERSEEHTSELQSLRHLVCRLLLEKKHTQAPGNGHRARPLHPRARLSSPPVSGPT